MTFKTRTLICYSAERACRTKIFVRACLTGQDVFFLRKWPSNESPESAGLFCQVCKSKVPQRYIMGRLRKISGLSGHTGAVSVRSTLKCLSIPFPVDSMRFPLTSDFHIGCHWNVSHPSFLQTTDQFLQMPARSAIGPRMCNWVVLGSPKGLWSCLPGQNVHHVHNLRSAPLV